MFRKVAFNTQNSLLVQRRFGGHGHHQHGVLLPEMKNNTAPNEVHVPHMVVDSYDTQIHSQTSMFAVVLATGIGLMYLTSYLPKEVFTGPPKKGSGEHH